MSGNVTDGSGHGWPMRAKITVDGYPGGPVYSDPYTGHYSVSLPAGTTYTMHVASADLPGYTGQDATVAVNDSDVSQDVALKVDASTCTALGYAYQDVGSTEEFTGWTGKNLQDGWTVTDGVGNGQTWTFDNQGGWAPPKGSDGAFADVDSEVYYSIDGPDDKQDTSLVSPVIDLSGGQGGDSPEIGYDSSYIGSPGQTGSVDLSLDGGTTWTGVHQPYSDSGRVDIPVPQAAGKSDVRVRFHFTGSGSNRRWEVDNVLVGSRSCVPQTGGLVAGTVTDANTGAPLIGAKVSSDTDATASGVTTATPDDAGLGDGYYWLFSPHTGSTGFSVTDGKYTPAQAKAKVPADAVLHRDFALDAGHVTIAQQSVSTSQVLGAATSKTETFGNDGTAPVHVNLSAEDGGFTAMGTSPEAATPSGAAPLTTRTRTSRAAATPTTAVPGSGPVLRAAGPAVGPWTDTADYPEPVQDDAVASHDGKVYVVGGFNGSYALQDTNVYDPSTQAWSPLAELPERLEAASAAFLGDTLYVVGGWNDGDAGSTHTYAYDPAKDTWTRMADLPTGVAAAGSAVVDGKLYVIGGCTNGTSCAATATVSSYDPGSNAWTSEPDYPTAVSFTACGGVAAQVVCAGGSGSTSLTSTYSYAPGPAAGPRRPTCRSTRGEPRPPPRTASWRSWAAPSTAGPR